MHASRVAALITTTILALTIIIAGASGASADTGKTWNTCMAVTWNTYGTVPAGEEARWEQAIAKAAAQTGLQLVKVNGKANIVIRYEPYTLLDGGTGRVHTWYSTDLTTGVTTYTGALVTVQTPTIKHLSGANRASAYTDFIAKTLGLASGDANKAAWRAVGPKAGQCG